MFDRIRPRSAEAYDGTVSEVTIATVDEATEELVGAFNQLVPQLSRSAKSTTLESLGEVLECDVNHVFVARDGSGDVVGTLTLVVFPIPTGVRAWIEDVIVDEAASGKGVGTKLTEAAIELAAEHGARTVDLTSRPSREAANHMYKRMGFELRETNAYRYSL